MTRLLAIALAMVVCCCAGLQAEGPKKKLLLIGQGPDGHPAQTHEYYAGLRVLEKSLMPVIDQIEIVQVRADGEWRDGPELLKQADGAVLYLAEGAKWVQEDPRRYDAFTQLVSRGGGLVGLHWAIGSREAKHIEGFQKLLGGVHGGADRKYKVLETSVEVVDPKHPITRGIEGFTIKDEFYYRLKFVDDAKHLQPLLKAKIEDELHPVCWAWEREDGGRSFGFSAMHYHDNWRREEYRRLVSQAVLWSLKIEPPEKDWPGDVDEADYRLK